MLDPTQVSYAYGKPIAQGQIKSNAEDFVVTENLGWQPEGEGEHIYLDITKKGENTAWVAKEIAKFAGVKENDVGYCGLKDRNALTRQWYSVYRPKGEALAWSRLSDDCDINVVVHQYTRGTKKLRRGDHASNSFKIVVRDLVNVETINKVLPAIAEHGVPNYFGEQRFGIDGNNLRLAQRWLEAGERHLLKRKKHFIISAARSYLFNTVLSKRIDSGVWKSAIDGDVIANGYPTGPLWGRGNTLVSGAAKELEDSALAEWDKWRDGLEHAGLKQERRELVAVPRELDWHFNDDTLTLDFELPIGSYATSVLREIVEFTLPILANER